MIHFPLITWENDPDPSRHSTKILIVSVYVCKWLHNSAYHLWHGSELFQWQNNKSSLFRYWDWIMKQEIITVSLFSLSLFECCNKWLLFHYLERMTKLAIIDVSLFKWHIRNWSVFHLQTLPRIWLQSMIVNEVSSIYWMTKERYYIRFVVGIGWRNSKW